MNKALPIGGVFDSGVKITGKIVFTGSPVLLINKNKIMKKRIFTSVVALSIFMCSQLFAQSKPTLSIGAELGIPVGDLNTTQKIGVGGSLKAAFPIFEGGAFTLSGGYIPFSGDEYSAGGVTVKRAALNFIPLKAGLRYMLTPGGVYMEPQLGYTAINTSSDNTTAKGGFTYAYNLGYMFNRQFDLSTRYEGVSRKNSNLNHIGFRLAYNFGL